MDLEISLHGTLPGLFCGNLFLALPRPLVDTAVLAVISVKYIVLLLQRAGLRSSVGDTRLGVTTHTAYRGSTVVREREHPEP